MKIGYPCINRSVGCTANHNFRLASYSETKLTETVAANLKCLYDILVFNTANSIHFFRIGSEIIPFASHPVCTLDWMNLFKRELRKIGQFVKKNGIRISMHPDQFVIINALQQDIVRRSVAELMYHCDLLDAMGLPVSAKVQIHVGGAYGDKKSAMNRFIVQHDTLPARVRKRLVIENDDRIFNVTDCLSIHEKTGIPVVLDVFHLECTDSGYDLDAVMQMTEKTWTKRNGRPIIDYSRQQPGERKGKHAISLHTGHFRRFLESVKKRDFDCMLEIKDKEKSALKALKVSKTLGIRVD